MRCKKNIQQQAAPINSVELYQMHFNSYVVFNWRYLQFNDILVVERCKNILLPVICLHSQKSEFFVCLGRVSFGVSGWLVNKMSVLGENDPCSSRAHGPVGCQSFFFCTISFMILYCAVCILLLAYNYHLNRHSFLWWPNMFIALPMIPFVWGSDVDGSSLRFNIYSYLIVRGNLRERCYSSSECHANEIMIRLYTGQNYFYGTLSAQSRGEGWITESRCSKKRVY